MFSTAKGRMIPVLLFGAVLRELAYSLEGIRRELKKSNNSDELEVSVAVQPQLRQRKSLSRAAESLKKEGEIPDEAIRSLGGRLEQIFAAAREKIKREKSGSL